MRLSLSLLVLLFLIIAACGEDHESPSSMPSPQNGNTPLNAFTPGATGSITTALPDLQIGGISVTIPETGRCQRGNSEPLGLGLSVYNAGGVAVDVVEILVDERVFIVTDLKPEEYRRIWASGIEGRVNIVADPNNLIPESDESNNAFEGHWTTPSRVPTCTASPTVTLSRTPTVTRTPTLSPTPTPSRIPPTRSTSATLITPGN